MWVFGYCPRLRHYVGVRMFGYCPRLKKFVVDLFTPGMKILYGCWVFLADFDFCSGFIHSGLLARV